MRESTPIPARQTLELMCETVDDGQEWNRRNSDGKSTFLAEALVQIPQLR